MAIIHSYAPLVGRILIVIIFIKSGLGKIPGFEKTAEYMLITFKGVIGRIPGFEEAAGNIASNGMPMVKFFLLGAIFLELAGSASILLGYKARYGAILLLIFLIPTTLIFHNFIADPEQMKDFLRNVTYMGGLFFIVGFGSGSLSLDGSGKEQKE